MNMPYYAIVKDKKKLESYRFPDTSRKNRMSKVLDGKVILDFFRNDKLDRIDFRAITRAISRNEGELV
jgi:hypothetical protein